MKTIVVEIKSTKFCRFENEIVEVDRALNELIVSLWKDSKNDSKYIVADLLKINESVIKTLIKTLSKIKLKLKLNDIKFDFFRCCLFSVTDAV